jgi:hypothetical protein
MTITPMMMYWITRLDYLQPLFGISGGVVVVFSVLVVVPCWAEGATRFIRPLLITLAIGLSSIIIACLIPSTKEAAAIIIIPKIVNNEKVQQIPSKLMDLANEWLDALKPKDSK